MSENYLTNLHLLQGYRFRVNFNEKEMPPLIVDETKPIGEDSGPNPSRLLSAAVGHCLSSSLLFCLSKARIKAKNMETTVRLGNARNEEGRLRVKDIEVQIGLEIDEEDRNRLPRCLGLFENYCTVTESVRRGIPVNVQVKPRN